MAFTDFLPIPEINRLFHTNDGRLCIVVDLLVKGDNSYVIAKDIVSEKQFEWNAVEWNYNIDTILSDTHPFVQEYAKSIKSAKELIQDELDEIQTKRNAGKGLKGKCGKFKEILWRHHLHGRACVWLIIWLWNTYVSRLHAFFFCSWCYMFLPDHIF